LRCEARVKFYLKLKKEDFEKLLYSDFLFFNHYVAEEDYLNVKNNLMYAACTAWLISDSGMNFKNYLISLGLEKKDNLDKVVEKKSASEIYKNAERILKMGDFKREKSI